MDENGGTSYPADPTGQNAGWITETSLDIDAVSAICPNCSILLVEASTSGGSDMLAAEATAARLGAKAISNSWGGPEYSGESSLESDFSFSGVAVVASAGDQGYGDTEWPSALPGVTAAGGTSLAPLEHRPRLQRVGMVGQRKRLLALHRQAGLADRRRLLDAHHLRHLGRRGSGDRTARL